MQVNSVGFQHANINAFKQNNGDFHKAERKIEQTFGESIDDSAVTVSISMNAKIVLYNLNSSDKSRDHALIQGSLEGNKNMFDYLSGKETSSSFSLKDLGYEGKPITQLSQNEASELLGDDGFFGIEQTSQRVSDFVLNFSGDDIALLKEGREGVERGFNEALKLFGGQLPDISYETHERTLQLIDEKITFLTQNNSSKQ